MVNAGNALALLGDFGEAARSFGAAADAAAALRASRGPRGLGLGLGLGDVLGASDRPIR
jgi:hypothetical protein